MAGTLFAPVTAVIMIFEITNNYSFIMPLMIASITSVVLARRLSHDSIYTVGLSHKGIRLHEGRDENILRTMHVGDIMRQEFLTVETEWPLSRIFDQLRKSPYSNLPVLNEDGTFAGILPFETLRLLINENSLSHLLIAKDLFDPDLPTLQPDEDLREALAKFADQNTDELPVICDEDSTIVGMLSRGELLVAYNHELLRRAADSEVFRARPIRISSHLHNAFDRFVASFKNGDVLGYKDLQNRSQRGIAAYSVEESTRSD
jgi:CIC family chloride channel protein